MTWWRNKGQSLQALTRSASKRTGTAFSQHNSPPDNDAICLVIKTDHGYPGNGSRNRKRGSDPRSIMQSKLKLCTGIFQAFAVSCCTRHARGAEGAEPPGQEGAAPTPPACQFGTWLGKSIKRPTRPVGYKYVHQVCVVEHGLVDIKIYTRGGALQAEHRKPEIYKTMCT